jgi:hypothetical protein
MVAPVDYIAEIIRDNHWGYLYNCACTVYPRLVRETAVQDHVIQIDPHVISVVIDVQVLPISASPFTGVLEPPTLE